jgi:hypothetical protein
MRSNEDGGINLKVALRPRRHIGRWPNVGNHRVRAQEQSAHLPPPIGIGKRLKARQQFA